MQTISGLESKKEFVTHFLSSEGAPDCLVIISEDETEDIDVVNEIARNLGPADYNVILCFGYNAPIFIVPGLGIAPRSRIILLVDGVPDAWMQRENVVRFNAPEVAAAAKSLVEVSKSL